MDKQEKKHLWSTALLSSVIGIIGAYGGALIGAGAALDVNSQQIEYSSRAQIMENKSEAYGEFERAILDYVSARKTYNNVYPENESRLNDDNYMGLILIPAQTQLVESEENLERTYIDVALYASSEYDDVANEALDYIHEINKGDTRGEYGGRNPLGSDQVADLSKFLVEKEYELGSIGKKEVTAWNQTVENGR